MAQIAGHISALGVESSRTSGKSSCARGFLRNHEVWVAPSSLSGQSFHVPFEIMADFWRKFGCLLAFAAYINATMALKHTKEMLCERRVNGQPVSGCQCNRTNCRLLQPQSKERRYCCFFSVFFPGLPSFCQSQYGTDTTGISSRVTTCLCLRSVLPVGFLPMK